MTTPKEPEVISYLSEVVKALKGLQDLGGRRNKTAKMKAIISLLKISEDRASATLHYARAGGHKELDVFIQQHIYSPIIEYLADQVVS